MPFVMTDEFSLRVTKITTNIGVSLTQSLPFCVYLFLTHEMAILSKGHEPNNFESNNSLRLSRSFISRKIFRFLFIFSTGD